MFKLNLKKKSKNEEGKDKAKTKEKKAKRKKFIGVGLKIVDEADGPSASCIIDDSDDDKEVEEMPQIVGVKDDRPLEMQANERFKDQQKWKKLNPTILNNYIEDHISPDSRINVNFFDDDLSPQKKNQDDDPDLSPPRKRKSDKDNDLSPPRKRRENDLSPPRKRRVAEEDLSPPRKRRVAEEDLSPPRKRRVAEEDLSPPRRNRRGGNEDLSPPRRNRRDEDLSPPRSNRRDRDDLSPPRREREYDRNSSSSRRARHNIEDNEPQRKRRDEDLSPPRRNRRDEDPSPPRKRRGNETLEGKKAGLQKGTDVRKELEELKRLDDQMFAQMDDEITGRNAETTMRDRETGKLRDFEQEREAKREKDKKAAEKKEVYDRWGKGLKQVEEKSAKIQYVLHEMSKPLARYSDDKDLDDMLKDVERDGDPMAKYFANKRIKEGKGPRKQRYNGPPPLPNRFGILPGCRWDGVDRSNGYEKDWFSKINSKKALMEESYKWSVEDL